MGDGDCDPGAGGLQAPGTLAGLEAAVSYLMLDPTPIALPLPEHCPTWTVEARSFFARGSRRWSDLVHTAVLALQNFHHVSKADACVYLAAHSWTDGDNRPGTLISLYFATQARIGRDALTALGRPLQASGQGWSDDGIHAAPDYAFPLLATDKGELVHVWMDAEGEHPYGCELTSRGAQARVVEVWFNQADPERYVPHAHHRRGTWNHADDARVQHREQLKLAFAYRVAERVVEADGVVDADERAFLASTFDPAHMESLWLDDPALRETLARQAEVELADLLGYHEKLGLLSTFFGACYADGKVAVQELKVLKEAAQALGLDNTEVVNYLRRLW